jgi:hypothetical protein
MKIESSAVELSSSHELYSYQEKKETLAQWVGGEDARTEAVNAPVKVNLSDAAKKQLQDLADQKAPQGGTLAPAGAATTPPPAVSDELAKLIPGLSGNVSGSAAFSASFSASAEVTSASSIKALIPQIKVKGVSDYSDLEGEDNLHMILLESLFYMATGRHIKLKIKPFNPDSGAESEGGCSRRSFESSMSAAIKFQADGGFSLNANSANNANNANGANGGQQLVGWGMEYNYHEETHESERVSFNARGLVKTADGKEIALDLELNMSRTFAEEKNLTIKAGDALIDPLVINYGGSSTDVSGSSFRFDIDSDGKEEEISGLAQGSGFLAIDKNGDGKINDGSELFGPKTGKGFSELSKYDDDKNGWIDENDSVYSKLKIWSKTGDGSESLVGIGSVGVGAIYLGKANTEFSFKNDAGALQAKMRDSGFYLTNDGRAGLVHELDLVV